MNQFIDFKNGKYIDLTHTLCSSIPNWSGNCGFQHKIISDYSDSASEVKFRVQSIEMSAGIGTHMDAPLHCFPGSKDIASLALEKLIAPCVKLDVSAKAHASYQLSADDIMEFENHHGIIEEDSFVIIRTGWDQFWDHPEKYRNELQFPGISSQAAKLLLTRNIAGIGIDTLSPDGSTDGFPVHQAILGAGKYIIENVANSHLLPAMGAYTIALPLKIQDATESPIRLIAILLNSRENN